MLTPHADMMQLARRVRRITASTCCPISVTCTGSIWSYRHGLHGIGHGALPSFHAGVMKPDTAIYAQAEQKFALVPGDDGVRR